MDGFIFETRKIKDPKEFMENVISTLCYLLQILQTNPQLHKKIRIKLNKAKLQLAGIKLSH